ncbi:MAG: carbon dioxide-concentrating mechanism protein CcmK [Oscillatoriales cyanobacterium]|jgi:microcompartment protein CcmL/EutN|nr:MAG: carbon dioxide-concentrating mechanism protein CcmK [Oscillatoriales cyanobacterium]
MAIAVGVIQALGFPGTLAAADAMVKRGRVTLVFFDKAERAEFMVVIRGPVSEVKTAMEAGIEAVENTYGAVLCQHYTIPNPPDNVVSVLPLGFTPESEPFRVMPG